MPADRSPSRVEARSRVSSGKLPGTISSHRTPYGVPRRDALFTSHSETRGLLNQPFIVTKQVPINSLLTHDKTSLSLVTNEEKRGTVTLLQSTEQAAELAEIAADARDYVAASRAENTTRVYRTGWCSSPPGVTSTG